jgi:hypothetical protein
VAQGQLAKILIRLETVETVVQVWFPLSLAQEFFMLAEAEAEALGKATLMAVWAEVAEAGTAGTTPH